MVDVKAAPVLEGVDIEVEVLPVVVVKVAASSKEVIIKQLDSKGLRLEGTELQGLFRWTASRRMRCRRASEVDTSIRLGCHQWSVIAARMQLLKSGGTVVARWGCRRKVENLFRFAVAVYGLRCPEKLPSPVLSSVWAPQ